MVEDEQDEVIQEFTAKKLGMVIERDARGRPVSIHIPSPFMIDQLRQLGSSIVSISTTVLSSSPCGR